MKEDQSATGRRRVFHLLDAIRGTAALIIVQRHSAGLFGANEWPGTYLAVDLFFVLSGFVIAHSYEAELRVGGRWRRFMALRLVRLYPLYLAGIVLGTVALVDRQVQLPSHRIDYATTAQSLISASLMLPNWGLPALVGPRWSLTYELVANAAYAALVRVLSTGVLITIMAASAIALILMMAAGANLDAGWFYYQAPMALARVGYSFFAGILLYRIFDRQVDRRLLMPGLVLLLAVCVAALAVTPTLAQGGALVLILAGFPILTLAAAYPDPTGRAAAVCGFLGVTSYAVYVVHQPAAVLFDALSHRIVGANVDPAPLAGFAFVIALVIGCRLLDQFYEKPVRAWLAARVGRLTPVSTLTPAREYA